jgi:pimeloyl-ACP methyl ester carboxylesterase
MLEVTFTIREVGGFSLRGEVVGDGSPTLLFLHYWGGSARTWRPVARHLATSYRCVAYDHRGWGRSDKPDADFAIADLAGDARSVIADLAPADIVLVGHSMGGKVAQLVAASRPPQLRALVLVAPAPAKAAVDLDDDARRRLLSAYESADSVRFAIDNVLTSRRLGDALRKQIVSDSLAGSPAATAAWPLSAIAEDVSASVHEIDVPTLVVAADHDVVEPVDLLREHVVAAIPNARLAVIPDCGHLIPLEQPKRLADEIASFIGRNP